MSSVAPPRRRGTGSDCDATVVRVSIRAVGRLRGCLPAAAEGGVLEMEMAPGSAAAAVMKSLRLPDHGGFLMLLNDERISLEQARQRILQDGDEILLLPPIQGG